jgi:hypothetical protein
MPAQKEPLNAPWASTFAGDEPTSRWVFAPEATIDDHAHYLVKTNGMEWRDPDLRTMKGYEVRKKLEPGYVRGRPVLIALIVDPGLVQNR